MHVNILGVHIDMGLALNAIPWPLFIAELLISVFFTSGFIRHYQDLYRYAEAQDEQAHWRHVLAHLGLVAGAIGTGLILHLMGYVVGDAGVMFHNLGLFLLVFPLLDDDVNLVELAARLAGLLWVWTMHHHDHFDRPQFWWSLALLAVAVVIMRWRPRWIRQHLWASIAIFAYTGIIFWFLLPPFAAGGARWLIAGRASLMYIGNAAMAAYLWLRQYQQMKQTARLRQLANYDQLTNAKTYSLYQRELTTMFEETRANGVPMTLVALDIDHFKQINDHYGHLAGNAVLIGVATTLSDVLSAQGCAHQIYRTGGEEFNIAFPDQLPQAVLPIVTACWDAVRKAHYAYENYDIAVTLSMGVTAVRATDHSIDDTYKRADDNLYLSKRAGRDTITVEGETVNSRATHDLIATYTYFTQGIMTTASGTPERARNELLLRLFDHEHDRWVLPEMFDISVATQIGLIQKTLAVTGLRRVSINLTTAQFADARVAETLTAFANSKEGPDQLTVEITDVPDVLTMRQITAVYRAGGIRVDIDDVGSDNSYEVVEHLLPYVDGVKFAMQNLRRTNDVTLLQERIRFWQDVAATNHLDFVLEGVENASEFAFARDELGITLFQGYYFSKPALPVL